MSNPARTPRVPSYAQFSLNRFNTDSYLSDAKEVAERCRQNKRLEVAQLILKPLAMDLHPTVYIPGHMTTDKNLRENGGGLARAANGGLTFRVRSAQGKEMANAGFAHLPEEGPHSQEVVRRRMQDTILVDVGAHGALGRLAAAYPKRSDPPPPEPITHAEAARALIHSGYTGGRGRVPNALVLNGINADGEQIGVNPNSDNGFPVLGKWSDPDAADAAMALALGIRAELEAGEITPWEWLRKMEACNPELVACRGKAKADYYPTAKVREMRMRFYNAFPRQVALIMQQSTQPFERNCESIVESADSRTGSGLTLVRGGAADLVRCLDRQLEESGYAYVHVGDDSWVAVKLGGKVVMFALDCSNFDLTQHNTVTEEVHKAIRDELVKIDRVSGELWYAYARERLTVVSTTLARKVWHAGPSGMPLQSKVNDMLMDVMICRLLERITAYDVDNESMMDKRVQEVGKAMGFAVRLEQFVAVPAASIAEALEQTSFLFVGYYFHAQGGQVMVHCDVARTMAQLPFPTLKWNKDKDAALSTEAMRLGSIAQGLGMPTPPLARAFEEMRQYAVHLVERAIQQGGDVTEEKLRWAVSENPMGPTVEPSLRGLLKVLQRDPAVLWLGELVGESTLVNWADEVDAEDIRTLQTGELGTGRRLVRPAPLRHRPVPTHPATVRNDGRPPPTAVWGPPKPKRTLALEHLKAARDARFRARGKGRAIAEEEVSTDDSVSWDSWGSE